MSEYESRGKGHSHTSSHDSAPSSARVAHQPARSAAEQAQEIITQFVHETSHLRSSVEAVRSAYASNNLEQWMDARARIDGAYARAERALERARGTANDSSPEAQQQLVAAERELAEQKTAAHSMTEAPTGFAAIADETEIVGVFAAPLEGGARIGFDKKQAALETRFDRLTPADRRTLGERLRRNRPNDPIAAAFSRLAESRRLALLEHLATTDRREAQRQEAERRGTSVVEVTDRVAEAAPIASTPLLTSVERAPVVVAAPEPLDVKLRRILEASDSDAAIETVFAQATADLDGTTRRALAKRLETYRPGGGDEIAARFNRLDRPLKQRVCNSLRSESKASPQQLPEGIRGELEAVTGTSLAHVNVHADEHGHATAAAHGARAVAIGSDIYMGEGQLDTTSDEGRELIAHEVAHVVQAQAHPGPSQVAATHDGDSIDAAELDADDLATQFRKHGGATSWNPSVGVTAGTPLRAPNAGEHKAPANVMLEKKLAGPKSDVAWAYLRANHTQFIAAVEKRLAIVTAPAHGRLAWVSGGTASRFAAALEAALGGEHLFLQLPELVHPADPWYVIDQNRDLAEGTAGKIVDGNEPKGPLTWRAVVGDALAIEIVARVRESYARMIPRYVVQLDAKQPDVVTPSDLVASHPMDRVTAVLLCDDAVVKPIAAKRPAKEKPSKDPTLFREGIRYVEDWKWLGDTDGKLWNWIEVKSPRDATVEEVAATLFHRDGAPPPSHLAYGITAAAPYFRVEPSWARKFFPDAKRHAPDGVDKEHADNGLALAESALATEAAIAQAADERKFDKRGIPLPPDLERLTGLLDRSHRQLERVKQLLIPWKLWDLVVPAAAWVAKYREHLLAVPNGRLVGLTPVIEGQQAILFEAAGAVQDVVAAAGRSAGADGDSGPVVNVLRQYATAIGESHLIDTARTHLATAHEAKAGMTLALMDRSLRESHDAVRDLKANESRMQWGGAVSASERHAADHRQLVELHAKRAAGEAIDDDDVELLAANLKEHAFDTRTKSLYLQLHNLREEARDSATGAVPTLALALEGVDLSKISKAKVAEMRLQMRFRDISPRLTTLMTDLRESVIDALPAIKQERLQHARAGATSSASLKSSQAWASNEAIQVSEQRLTEFVGRHRLADVIKQAISKIEDQRIQTLVVQIGILIGVGVVGGVAGSIIGGAVRGALLADAAVASMGMMRTARAVGTIANIATDATVNSIGQVMVMGGSGSDAFVDNFLSNAAIRVALAPLHKVAAAWAGAELELQNLSKLERLGHRTKTTIGGATLLTAEMITGAAVSHAVHRARHSRGPVDDETAAAWALEGASMVVGRFIGGRVSGIEKRLAQMAEHGAHLRVKAAKLRQLAKKVDETGDKDEAMELLVKHHELVEEEGRLLGTLHDVSKGKVSREIVETLVAGNRFDAEGVKGITSAALPLRLSGLTPDDGSMKTWVGQTEDISIALHQASRAGLKVKVLEHDAAARQWRVSVDNEVLTIIETPLRGRPRGAKPDPTDADRKHAQRYAGAATFMQDQWEARVKVDIDSRPVVEVDHLQVGYSFAGVINQATLPQGMGTKLVVYQDKGTLAGRGKQELGQDPKTWDGVGVRGSEQAGKDDQWITSEAHGRSLEVGRIETQTPSYRGSATSLEARPKGHLPEDWRAPHRAFRVKVRDASGTERWFYTNRFDNTGGMGPGDLSQVKRIVDPAQLQSMLASNQLLRGEDPDYAKKARSGQVFIWGGTPTGAWAAEHAGSSGASVTLMGDTRPPQQDWHGLISEYGELVAQVAKLPPGQAPAHVQERMAELHKLISRAHSGAALPRNHKRGAAYENGIAGKGNIAIDFGTPSKITLERGHVIVTIGQGDNAKSRVYDQVVIAHGQDPGAPGAPGGLLGKGAQRNDGDDRKVYEEVPAGTIALRPIWSPAKEGSNERDVLGLESVDPEGIRLLGAAYASKKLSPWVKQSERAGFEAAIDRMAQPNAPTRDRGPISKDSTGVPAGAEIQRDREPRANEVLGAKTFRLPGPEQTFELDADRSKWDEQVREWFTINTRADRQWVSVKRLGGGKSGAVVYRIKLGDNDLGVFKIFDTKDGAKHEQEMLQLLASAKLTKMTVVGDRGRMSVDPQSKMGGAVLMDIAKGTSIKELIEAMPSDPVLRDKAFKQLEFAMKRAAEGLAEMHARFSSKTAGGATKLMTKEAKLSDANYFLENNLRGGEDVAKVKAALGDDFQRVKAALEGPMLQGFLDADVPATAYHGDANSGNFVVHDYNKQLGYKDVGMIDVGSMKWSVDGGKGTKTGAADLARLLGSLDVPGKLSAPEVNKLRTAFEEVYFNDYKSAAGHGIDKANYWHAEKWYRLEFEIAVLKGDARAKGRILKLLGMEKTQ